MLNFLKKSSGPVGWIVVFLGNPGGKYTNTRHNVGFMCADKCEKATGAKINRARFKALTDSVKVNGEGVLLMKPQTYMNLSGDALIEAVRFYKVPAERVIVISDDVSLSVGKLRIRGKGSAGGHNGLKSIIARLGSDTFPRVKIGVGAPPHPEYDMADWVLGSFKNQDAVDIDAAVGRAWEAVETIIKEGVERAQSRFN